MEPVTSIEVPVRLDYSYAAGRASRRFLEGIAKRQILGQRCPSCERVYVPARGSCPRCAVPTDE
ncbi:MAG: zinc ribbon domain-containing protein, partial [Myxococcota bacterium]